MRRDELDCADALSDWFIFVLLVVENAAGFGERSFLSLYPVRAGRFLAIKIVAVSERNDEGAEKIKHRCSKCAGMLSPSLVGLFFFACG